MVLDGVADLVGGNRYCREGLSSILVFSQSYCFRFRIVVVALVSSFNDDVANPLLFQQVTRQVTAGSRIPVGRDTVAVENARHPDAGPKDRNQKQDDADEDGHF